MDDSFIPIFIDAEKFLNFPIDEVCKPGILSNLELLEMHAHILDRYLESNATEFRLDDAGGTI